MLGLVYIVFLLQSYIPVNNVIQVVANVSDATADPNDVESGIAWVDLWLDSSILVEKKTAPPYNFSFDTKLISNGQHYFVARAGDVAGNTGWSNVLYISVQNTGVQVTDIKAPTIIIEVK